MNARADSTAQATSSVYNAAELDAGLIAAGFKLSAKEREFMHERIREAYGDYGVGGNGGNDFGGSLIKYFTMAISFIQSLFSGSFDGANITASLQSALGSTDRITDHKMLGQAMAVLRQEFHLHGGELARAADTIIGDTHKPETRIYSWNLYEQGTRHLAALTPAETHRLQNFNQFSVAGMDTPRLPVADATGPGLPNAPNGLNPTQALTGRAV